MAATAAAAAARRSPEAAECVMKCAAEVISWAHGLDTMLEAAEVT